MPANPLLPILALVAASGMVTHQDQATSRSSASAAATQFVRNFFAALDSRDIDRVRKSFAPTATIVHDDGVEQRVPEFVASIEDAKHWYPRTRKIDCHAEDSGTIVIAGCLNEVTFKRPDGQQKAVAYNETWILRRTDAGLKAIRTHYSRIRKSSHAE